MPYSSIYKWYIMMYIYTAHVRRTPCQDTTSGEGSNPAERVRRVPVAPDIGAGDWWSMAKFGSFLGSHERNPFTDSFSNILKIKPHKSAKENKRIKTNTWCATDEVPRARANSTICLRDHKWTLSCNGKCPLLATRNQSICTVSQACSKPTPTNRTVSPQFILNVIIQ